MDRAAAVATKPPDLDPDGRALPSLRDTWVRALVVLTLVLQCFAWSRVEGYQIADSVEFMEIAQSFVRGEERVDAGLIRPFGFSFILLPFFALADWIGLRDLRAVVWCVTLVEILLGCVLVVLTARVAARVGGRACALAAGFLVATNPVFLQYSTQPESGIPAGVCIALALEKLLVRRGKQSISGRDALVGGLWLGAAFLVAYKTLLVSAVLVVLLVLRDRWSHRRTWIAAGAGLFAALALQSVLDWAMYDAFGASVFNYLAQNTGSVLTSVFLKVHFAIGGGIHGVPLLDQPRSWWLDRAEDIYRIRAEWTGESWYGPSEISLRGKMSPWFYVTQLPTMLPWPAIAMLAIGTVVAVVKRNVAAVMLIVLLVVNVAAMSNKGQKEFRIWLPLLAILMPVTALGFAWLADAVLARVGSARKFATIVLFAAIAAFSLRSLTDIEMRRFGGYWVAMDWVNARAAESLPARAEEARRRGLREPEHVRVAAAYHWAVFRRGSPIVDPVKLPWQLNMWSQYMPDEKSGFVTQHNEDLAALEEVDVFLVHLPILSEHPELMRWVAAGFEVAAAFYDQSTYGDLGPIFVLQRRSSDPRGRRFFEERRGLDLAQFQADRELRGAFDFIDPEDPDGERLQLLGIEYQEVPPQGFGWITYHWSAPRKPARDWTLVDRITPPDEHYVWDNGHRAAYGALPTDAWDAGTIVSESYLVVPASEPYRSGAPFHPIGGAYRRGDLLPVRCWMGVRAYGPDPGDGTRPPVERELVAARPGARTPARPVGATDLYQTADGTQFSADGLVRARGLLLPVLDAARLPDDGRPIRD
ncbi:MAG: glycosyltransferase family 39 protein [Planctomycetota bacterium]|nr:glycosyltransferase family 39 protein [Planctomycetota bacterium]